MNNQYTFPTTNNQEQSTNDSWNYPLEGIIGVLHQIVSCSHAVKESMKDYVGEYNLKMCQFEDDKRMSNFKSQFFKQSSSLKNL